MPHVASDLSNRYQSYGGRARWRYIVETLGCRLGWWLYRPSARRRRSPEPDAGGRGTDEEDGGERRDRRKTRPGAPDRQGDCESSCVSVGAGQSSEDEGAPVAADRLFFGTLFRPESEASSEAWSPTDGVRRRRACGRGRDLMAGFSPPG